MKKKLKAIRRYAQTRARFLANGGSELEFEFVARSFGLAKPKNKRS